MNKFVAFAACLLLLSVAGCGTGFSEETINFQGITINVSEPTGNSSSHRSAYDGVTKQHTFDLTSGDVTIHLENTPDGPITFELNGQDYGTLNEGDIVRIDEARTTMVNDLIRKPVAK